jgi:hypothetical protein
MVSRQFFGRRRLLLLLLVAFLVAFAPMIEIAGLGYARGAVSAKGGNGNGHGDKGKGHKNKGSKGNRNRGENGENRGKGKKNGHHKIEQASLTAVPLAQSVVTPTPTRPPELPATTGTILVIAFDCPAGVNPNSADWFATCTNVSSGVTFRLMMNGAPADSATTGTTDDQGNLTFGNLDPGTYHLTEETGDWCHAESDNVDENGDVIVGVSERSTVWIFHCPPALAS